MKRWRRGLTAFIAAAAFGVPGIAVACGTLDDWVGRYTEAGATDSSRVSALQELAAYCGDYFGAENDRALRPVLSDALVRGYDQSLVQQVFNRFLCLSAIRNDAERLALAQRLDLTGCSNEARLMSWRRVAGDGVNFRDAPSRSAARLATLPKGVVVEAIDQSGEWAKVRTIAGAEGFVHGSLLTPATPN